MAKERPNLKLVNQASKSNKASRPRRGGIAGSPAAANNRAAKAPAYSSKKNSEPRPEEVFDIVSLKDLSSDNRHKIIQTVSEISSDATLIGVGHTPEAWDLRPAIMVKGEKLPSIIRFLGPELSKSEVLTKKLTNTFAKLKNQKQLSLLKDYGSLDGQLWYRREFVEYTLDDFFRAGNKLDFKSSLRWCSQLLEQLDKISSLGLTHGHISASNIGIVLGESSTVLEGKLVILDTSVRVSLVEAERLQSKKSADTSKSFKKLVYSRYLLNNLAPEILESKGHTPNEFEKGAIFLKSDIFGLGKIFQDLLSKSDQSSLSKSEKENFQQKLAFIYKMVDDVPSKRPEIEEVKEVLGDFLRGIQSNIKSDIKDFDEIPKEENEVLFEDDVSGEDVFEEDDLIKELENDTLLDDNLVKESSFDNFKNYQKPSNNFTILMAGLFSLALATFLYFNYSAPIDYSSDELSVLWSSGVPSKMQVVSEMALLDEEGSDLAQSLILASLNDPNFAKEELNRNILKIAFDPRWERELSFEDRRFAIALYLAKILEPEFLAKISSEQKGTPHPGVILAIAASDDERTSSFLSGVDISYLFSLPRPISDAFRNLASAGEKLNCSDQIVRTLAKLSAFGMLPGFENSEKLHSFVAENSQLKLKSLTILFNSNEQDSENILNSLLKHPNLLPDSEFLIWGMKQKLTTELWSKNLSSSARLALLSGNLPSNVDLNKSQLESLFLHPAGEIRAAAMGLALERFEWNHPGTVDVFKSLMESPDQLSALQTARLAPMLSDPARVPKNIIADWLKENPSLKLVSKLILSTSNEKEPTELDFVIAQYLENKGWSPSTDELLKLSVHPERTVRLRVYEKAFEMKNKKEALKILETAKKTESDLGFLDSLEEKIEHLKK